jgi:hypothetical protein
MGTMLCDDVRNRMMEFVDKELDPSEVEAVEGHVSWCSDCAETLSATRAEIEAIDRAVREAMRSIGPETARRERFIEKASTPRVFRIRPLLELAAAALLFAASFWFWVPDSTVDRYRETLAQLSHEQLQKVSKFQQAGLLDELIPLEAAVLEDALLASNGALQVASWDPRPQNPARRSASRRYLASLPRRRLEETLPQIQDESLACYARALLRATEEPRAPAVQGKPHWSISLSQKDTRLVFEQWRSGAVRVTTIENGKKSQALAADVFELMEKEPDLCRRFGIAGEGRTVKVGLPVKSAVSIRRGVGRVLVQRDMHRAADELASIRMDALMAELVRSQGENAPALVQKIQAALASVAREPRLDELKRRLSPEEAEQVRSLEQVHERILRLGAFCDSLR